MSASFGASSALNIHDLASQIQRRLDAQLPSLLGAKEAEFQTLFEEVGDSAYGTMNTQLFAPIREFLRDCGLVAKPRLPGSFQTSREWGNADESHQQRWMWSVINRVDGLAVGALAVGSHHSHLRFHVPRSPEIIGMEASTPAAIVRELSLRLPEFGSAQEFKAWYAEYLAREATSGTK